MAKKDKKYGEKRESRKEEKQNRKAQKKAGRKEKYAAYQGVLAAVQSGELSEERIDESVKKILKTKIGMLEE